MALPIIDNRPRWKVVSGNYKAGRIETHIIHAGSAGEAMRLVRQETMNKLISCRKIEEVVR